MKALFTQTRREKAGNIDGMNLFFGALLGANLGTLEGLRLYDYATVILVLAAAVVTLRIFSASERRVYAWVLVASYVLLVGYILLLPANRPAGLSESDAYRLAVTLAIWLGATFIVEFIPVRESEAPAEKA